MPRRRLPADRPSSKNTNTTKHQRSSASHGVPDVYRDMLAEAAASDSPSAPDARASKKRKTSREPPVSLLDPTPRAHDNEPPRSPIHHAEPESASPHAQQVIYDDSEASEMSDADFEDVELEPVEECDGSDGQDEMGALQIDLSNPIATPSRKNIQSRKPATKSERDFRLNVHKWHLLCLLLHLRCRNQWCDSTDIHSILKPLVPHKVVALLHSDESKPQYQRVHSFNKAIEELCAFWAGAWQITERGLRKAMWRETVDVENESEVAGDPVDFDDFKGAAKSRQGSRDVGAQLFCALLRSVALDTRLVLSFQPLPFAGVAKESTPVKSKSKYIYAPSQAFSRPHDPGTVSDMPDNPRWRVSEHAGTLPSVPPQSPHKRVRDSPYPVFWVEVFSPAATAWIPLDPLVRRTVNKPKTGFEPPASDLLNQMSYVVAFEDDGSAKDVTRRYTQFYNAKTRKLRVESTKGGARWWHKTMTVFEKPFSEDRDAVEDVELAKREAAEPMPKNVQDFKDHPIYVLERHLRQNEVIHPRREAGKVGTGVSKGRHGKAESVYRRQDVHTVRSADQWYRRGRDIKQGKTGLKRKQPKPTRGHLEDEHSDSEANGSMLYAEFQTDIYIPPPVVRGKIPKNAYGNLDVYVPTMIPPGAIHIQHPDAARAAKVLGVSYADAVTGFDFKGRQGTARINGVVIPVEYQEALVEAIETLQHERITAEEARKSALMLQLWKRFLTALRIRQKVEHDYASNSGDDKHSFGEYDESDGTYQDQQTMDVGGGFLHDASQQDQSNTGIEAAMPPIIEYHKTSFTPEDLTYHEVIVVESPHTVKTTGKQISSLQPANEQRTSGTEGGGFLIDDDNLDFNHDSGLLEDADEDEAHAGGLLAHESLSPAEPQCTPVTRDQVSLEGEHKEDNAPNIEMRGGRPNTESSSLSDLESRETSPRQSIATEASSREAIFKASNKRGQARSHKSPLNDADSESLMSHDPEDEEADPEWLVDSS